MGLRAVYSSLAQSQAEPQVPAQPTPQIRQQPEAAPAYTQTVPPTMKPTARFDIAESMNQLELGDDTNATGPTRPALATRPSVLSSRPPSYKTTVSNSTSSDSEDSDSNSDTDDSEEEDDEDDEALYRLDPLTPASSEKGSSTSRNSRRNAPVIRLPARTRALLGDLEALNQGNQVNEFAEKQAETQIQVLNEKEDIAPPPGPPPSYRAPQDQETCERAQEQTRTLSPNATTSPTTLGLSTTEIPWQIHAASIRNSKFFRQAVSRKIKLDTKAARKIYKRNHRDMKRDLKKDMKKDLKEKKKELLKTKDSSRREVRKEIRDLKRGFRADVRSGDLAAGREKLESLRLGSDLTLGRAPVGVSTTDGIEAYRASIVRTLKTAEALMAWQRMCKQHAYAHRSPSQAPALPAPPAELLNPNGFMMEWVKLDGGKYAYKALRWHWRREHSWYEGCGSNSSYQAGPASRCGPGYKSGGGCCSSRRSGCGSAYGGCGSKRQSECGSSYGHGYGGCGSKRQSGCCGRPSASPAVNALNATLNGSSEKQTPCWCQEDIKF